jgi:soluble lytic murein transglycosylase
MNIRNAYDMMTEDEKQAILNFSDKFEKKYHNPLYRQVSTQKRELFTSKKPINNSFTPIVNDSSARYGVEPQLIMSVIKAESDFNTNAHNKGSNARGLMQITPIAEIDIKKAGVQINDIYNPKQNIEAGTYYLSKLIKKFNDVPLALAAYNAGMGNVNKWMKQYGTSWNDISKGLSRDGIFKETRDYVSKIVK